MMISFFVVQNATIQTSTNGQIPASASEDIQLKCNYCRSSFSIKPEILEWEVGFLQSLYKIQILKVLSGVGL